MQCALCHKDATLRKSHVIPEFMYKPLYDGFHRFQSLSSEASEKNSWLQKGLREALLCDSCEQQFGNYESYVSLLFSGRSELPCEIHGQTTIVRGVDYVKLRLFQLSILWRAGISSLPFFKNVCLGPDEEHLRQLLRSESTGVYGSYGCSMFSLKHEGVAQKDVIIPPDSITFNGLRGYRFVFGGFVWAYTVGRHQNIVQFGSSLLPSGELCIGSIEMASVEFLVDLGADLYNQNKI